MKLRKILAVLWAVLLLLVGTCYAENTEDPIIAYIDYGYYRLNMPSVKKVEYYGYSFIECSYTRHLEQMLPYGIPYVTQSGPYYAWFDPLNNKMLYLDESQPNADKNWYDMSYLKDIGGESQYAYNAIRDSFPNLCEEVLTDNQLASEKYGNEISKAIAAQKDEDWKTEYNSLKQAYDKGCQSQGILRDLAESAWKSGDYDTAIEWAGKRIEMNPSGDAYNTRAWWYYLLGQNDKALEDAEWAVFKDKNYAYILDTRGSIYYELGQYDKAIADFNAAIKLDDKFAHAYFYRSKCYEALGNKDKSNADYKQAKKYDNEIIDDKTVFANQQSQMVAKNQLAHQQKLNKYKDTLKKLNDAVYVCNNASQFPKRTVFDSANAIIIDTEKIKYDEGEEFYQEVIPQEVRNNYENGVYQQQYEQLKAEVEAEEAAAAAAVAVNEPQIAAAPVRRTTYACNSECDAIAQNPSSRHNLRDELWESLHPDRFQHSKTVADAAAYWSNNVIYYCSYKEWKLEMPENINYTRNQLQRNNVTDYGTYVIVTESPTEKYHYICFDFNFDTNTFYIYDNKTKKHDYSLIFVKDPSNGRPLAHLVNISGQKGNFGDGFVDWTERDYSDNVEAFFARNVVDFVPTLQTDGFRLFLQYSGVLF
ncbi:TPR repeat-containing protein [Anaerovibrio lipolyticus DSM 3074]|uniref:Tetratricopeptide repeat protein n=2 Tax=Anaerovibrio lipolyticus TaxID=82374 RepID=A0A0B2JLM2_9FIRM|nr:tetratricopeptide repeat protein [Anaerovibrio lipolyticus]KHM47256.1 hypothetical protein NZ47_13600 [Anaerovibrio lipolyticus]SHI30046.1 TPR repeat-containing protein [Anaerovibrio lipolyticus DSM 3074]